MRAELEAIHIYPVKSCRGLALEEVQVVATGLALDRVWQVVDADGTPITQSDQPRLATVQPELSEDHLQVSIDGAGAVSIPKPSAGNSRARSVLGVEVEVADAGDEVSAWFSELLETPCRLVGLTADSDVRLPDELPLWSHELSFADAAQVLVVNSASLEWLSDRASEPFGMDRFRPNLSVRTATPWVEDTWQTFTVGEAQVVAGFPWPRCSVPQVDQHSGVRHKEPARALREHRWCSEAPGVPDAARGLLEGNALFGLGCHIGPVGAIARVGDPVTVSSASSPLIEAPT